MNNPRINHATHWGSFAGTLENGRLVVVPNPADPDPSPILRNVPASVDHPARVRRPMVRRGWLENGPGPTTERGRDPLVAVPWDEVLDRLAGELRRVHSGYGPTAIFGGSYGWSSAGRFHHAQSQIHRFLRTIGGYVDSVNTYSAGAANVIIPHTVGEYEDVYQDSHNWQEVEDHSDVILAFGGMSSKNWMVSGGNLSRHSIRDSLLGAKRRGARFILFGPIRDDLRSDLLTTWHQNIPGSDAALMLAIGHTLIVEGLHDQAFLDRYCVGFDALRAYILGESDGQPKDAAWASAIAGIPASAMIDAARLAAGRRTLITVAQSVQRAEFGEQPVWLALALSAMLGQVGLPGGGFGYGLGSMGNTGKARVAVRLPTLPQGTNPVSEFIPVARIADLLLHPGESFDYDGKSYTYPKIRLVYWAGGNPFHHHQDLPRLERAFGTPDTIVVHESAWTATARRADIILPATVTLERDDIGASSLDPFMTAMHRLSDPVGEARDDYAIFSALAERLGLGEAFTEGRTAEEWLRHLYARTRQAIAEAGGEAPDFDTFWQAGEIPLPTLPPAGGSVRRFRADPERHPLRTPSGRIEIASSTIAGFGYADCPGHPVWLPRQEGAGSERARQFPLQLVSNQPWTRLHSQLDFGSFSQHSKSQGREPLRIHPNDAAARGIAEGDIVLVYNDRGGFLAAAHLSRNLMPGVMQIATGAWYDPVDMDGLRVCVHGNPNAVTRDVGTSRLAQGCCGQLASVEIRRFDRRPLPPIRVFEPPDGSV